MPELDAGAIEAQSVLQSALDVAVVAPLLHVDEVDDDQAGEVAQAQLAGDFVGRLELVLSAVSSMEYSRVGLPEFTSMATSASVWLMTR